MGVIEEALNRLEEAFFIRMRQYMRLANNPADRLLFLDSIDMVAEMEKVGLGDVVSTMQKEYGKINKLLLTGEPAQAVIDELNMVMALDTQFLLGEMSAYGDQFKANMFKGILTGESLEQTMLGLQELGLARNHLITSLETAKDQYQRMATARVYDKFPNQKFTLGRILDDRTRCSCRAVMMNQDEGGYTKAEIDAGAWTNIAKQYCPEFEGEYSFIKCGGYNCRHNPIPVRPKV